MKKHKAGQIALDKAINDAIILYQDFGVTVTEKQMSDAFGSAYLDAAKGILHILMFGSEKEVKRVLDPYIKKTK